MKVFVFLFFFFFGVLNGEYSVNTMHITVDVVTEVFVEFTKNNQQILFQLTFGAYY
jgi:hypothetical protein